jgi:hypothetical protein
VEWSGTPPFLQPSLSSGCHGHTPSLDLAAAAATATPRISTGTTADRTAEVNLLLQISRGPVSPARLQVQLKYNRHAGSKLKAGTCQLTGEANWVVRPGPLLPKKRRFLASPIPMLEMPRSFSFEVASDCPSFRRLLQGLYGHLRLVAVLRVISPQVPGFR